MAPWEAGQRPERHPLWERQVELEMQMVERGAAKYRKRLAKAKDKQEMTSMRPYRRILEDMVEVGGKAIGAWQSGTERATKRKANHRGVAYTRLRGMDPYVCAFVAARTILDGVTVKRLGLRAVAGEIGQAVEYEARMESWVRRAPGLFREVGRGLRNQKATATHKKRVNIHQFNKLLRVKHRWHDWTSDERLHVGLKLIDIMARVTGHISVIPDPNHKVVGKKMRPPYIVMVSDELLGYLQDATVRDEERSPLYLPTLMPPRRWEGVKHGGYYTPIVRLPKLIRFKADNEENQGVAADEYDSLDMPQVFDALDKVQEVPWRVNRKVLAVAWDAWERDLGIGKLGKREPLSLPPAHPGQRREDLSGDARRDAEQAWREAHPKLFAEWKREAAKVYGENARRVSNTRTVLDTLHIAEDFKRDEFYFPHMLDFRGRMYPIPAYLQPQGSDLARGLLTFAHGRPLGENGAFWLGVHLANCWGNDKISFTERYNWALENFELWRKIAEYPLKHLEWTQADEPWQSLAAIIEFVRIGTSEDPASETSSLPIRLDGTCNGIQHLSAMMRDPVGGASVNLLPSQEPRDIYGEVATELQGRLEGIRDSGGREGAMADMWLKAFGPGGVPRKFTKGPVMVTPYGGTRDSFKGSTLEWLKENNPPAIPDRRGKKYNLRFEATLWIVPLLLDAVNARVGEAKRCMEWLKKCAGLVADAEQPIWWTTSVGFHVRHFYGTLRRRQVETRIDGKRVDVVDWERTKKLNRKDQLQGIAPNFVHSQDAAVNMETILEFMSTPEELPFTSIHDAFGTVAGGMDWLFECIRQAFVRIHQEDVLHLFRTRCVLMLRDYLMATKKGWGLEQCWEEANDLVDPVPAKGDLDIREVLNADYFFA